MAKVSRKELKGIVKECLMEILAEGLLHDVPSAPKRKKRRPAPSAIPRAAIKEEPQVDEEFSDMINERVLGLTSDPIMAEIFKDTAMTTLQQQLGAEENPRAVTATDVASQQVANSDLGDLFGGSADRWASLAFAEKKD